MNDSTLAKGQQLSRERDQARADLERVQEVLANYDRYGSTVSFKLNATGQTLSFGSKKFDFRAELKPVLERISQSLQTEINTLTTQFEAL